MASIAIVDVKESINSTWHYWISYVLEHNCKFFACVSLIYTAYFLLCSLRCRTKMAERFSSGNIQTMLECPLCFGRNDDRRFLPCHHWFCATCINQLIETAHFPNRFPCPNCRVEVPIPPGKANDFPTAYIINSLEDAVTKQIKSKLRCIEHEKDLDLYCDKCQKNICAKCVRQHHGHTIMDVDEVKERNQKPFNDLRYQITHF